ncbi:MAG: hypothetical protein IKL22_07445 [Lachnospiraceae bacterium]|nr:hypothetical protein [Lachnospiraceae bacterium]
MPNLLKNFLHCGLSGWCFEILFTALGSLRNRDFTLKGKTSVWMFPIYGSAAFLSPLFKLLRHKSLLQRGLTYMSLIFSAEFISGKLLSKKDLCPWDYSRAKWNIQKVIRLDYAPLWFLTGLFFEKLTISNKPKTH